jgi:hypothetical protein
VQRGENGWGDKIWGYNIKKNFQGDKLIILYILGEISKFLPTNVGLPLPAS